MIKCAFQFGVQFSEFQMMGKSSVQKILGMALLALAVYYRLLSPHHQGRCTLGSVPQIRETSQISDCVLQGAVLRVMARGMRGRRT